MQADTHLYLMKSLKRLSAKRRREVFILKKTTKKTANNKKVKDESHVVRYLLLAYLGGVLMFTVAAVPCFAAADPIAVVNNLSTFIFSLIRAIGLILLGFGIVQVGLSLKSHDPSQRANGFMTLAGGVIITFAKEILNLIVGG